MFTITATEFKNNFGEYLKKLENGDIILTKNGTPIAHISNIKSSPVSSLSGLLKGSISENYDKYDLKKDRLESKYGIEIDD